MIGYKVDYQRHARLSKEVLKQLTPPIVWSTIRAAASSIRSPARPSREEQPADYYDRMAQHERWRVHYTESHYYFFWSIIADRLVRFGAQSVLDLGCGSGQLAVLLGDRGIKRYCGVDFSGEQIRLARAACPQFEFVQSDITSTDILECGSYDAIVATEFLEHIDGDLEVVKRIHPRTFVLASLPNYDDPSHVRFFASPSEIASRYASFFDSFRVDALRRNTQGIVYYLLEGVRR